MRKHTVFSGNPATGCAYLMDHCEGALHGGAKDIAQVSTLGISDITGVTFNPGAAVGVVGGLCRLLYGRALLLSVSGYRCGPARVKAEGLRKKLKKFSKKVRLPLARGLSVLRDQLLVQPLVTGVSTIFKVVQRRDYRTIFFFMESVPGLIGKTYSGFFLRRSGKLSWKALSRKKESVWRLGKSSPTNLVYRVTEGAAIIRNNTGSISLNFAIFYC